ncbi:hypothetical protein KNT64_gp093 [Pseudomonas phage PspYZU05]|uniref:Uncharacterized protein n=1 Tax=Pseudomonas phage PspYZU05 TaxID=1983556 RepID=A0A2U7N2K2_9CAUD|nr:hypothetical protein KNT64_gp093 [Pseudomonas phage PspYZU05]ASD52045.1 hypothetical protein PspYZU05_93 [Pseudomonas phage PspYZU05]
MKFILNIVKNLFIAGFVLGLFCLAVIGDFVSIWFNEIIKFIF